MQAEADDIRINCILKLEAAGYGTDSIDDALEIAEQLLNCCVRVTINHQRLRTIKPDVDEGDEVAGDALRSP